MSAKKTSGTDSSRSRLGGAARRCVFFDRDGIVNESPGPGQYVLQWADFRLMPAFVDALRIVAKHGCHAAIVTNQRAVAKGLLTTEGLEEMHRRLERMLAAEHSLRLLDIAYCPHDENECSCRKPQPGMLLALSRKHGLDLASSWMVGDSASDVEAGRRAGCRTILVAGKGKAAGSEADITVGSISELPDALDAALSPKT